MCFPSARIAIKASQLARTKNGRPGRPLQRGVSVSDAPPVHAVHACRCGEPGSAVGEPGLELPARHRSDRGVCPKAAEVLEKAEADALGYLDFPCEHHVSLRTKNVQERTDRELKRRSRVIQVFPSRK